jgi:uncharacterized protein YcsI (UPF0317 family)
MAVDAQSRQRDPAALRAYARSGSFDGTTAGHCHGFAQANYGDRVDVRAGEVPVFWACGVTPQAVALASSLPWMLTHAPGRMLVLDLANERLRS